MAVHDPGCAMYDFCTFSAKFAQWTKENWAFGKLHVFVFFNESAENEYIYTVYIIFVGVMVFFPYNQIHVILFCIVLDAMK